MFLYILLGGKVVLAVSLLLGGVVELPLLPMIIKRSATRVEPNPLKVMGLVTIAIAMMFAGVVLLA